MGVFSKVVEVGGNDTVDIQPEEGDFRVTSIMTVQGVGVKFVNDEDDETKVVHKNQTDLDTEIYLRESNWMAIENGDSSDKTVFLSIEVV